jgi:hypothetical protein
MDDTEALKQRIKDLEAELVQLRSTTIPARPKIDKMSPEVIQSNPYRYYMKNHPLYSFFSLRTSP